MLQLLVVVAIILLGIGSIWSAMGLGNELVWWSLTILVFCAFLGVVYLGCLLLLTFLQRNQRTF